MDGVLVDSEPFIQEAATRMFAELGVSVRHEDFGPFVGAGEARFVTGVAAKYGVQVDVEHGKARMYAIYLELIRGRLQALPGVFSFIAECRRRRLKLAVASSADAIKVQGNLAELHLHEEMFDALVNGSQVERKKPAPDLFLAAAARLDVPAPECLVVEDAVAGVAAAKAAGARCLALTTSFPPERLQQADWIAPNLAHVPTAVFQHLPAPQVV
jgi:HAD superfamily hydrolase (TIGR01509 family)